MLTNRPLVAAFAAVSLAGCASPATTTYVAPTRENIRSSSENAPGMMPERVIYVENLSTVPVIVTQMTLISCVNIKQPCNEVVPLNVRVLPGNRVPVYRTEPLDRRGTYSHSYTWRWRSEGRTTAAQSALAEAGSVEAQQELATRPPPPVRSGSPPGGPPSPSGNPTDFGRSITAIIVEPDTISMRVGETMSLAGIRVSMQSTMDAIPTIRAVTRLYPARASGAVIIVGPDSVRATTPGQGTVEFSLPTGIAAQRSEPLAPGRLTITVRP